MFNLFPVSLLIMALGGLLYIVSNHLSELGEDNDIDDSGFGLKARLVEWINQLPIENVKDQSLSITQKLLHKLRIQLLKADNHLMKLIGLISERDKAKNGNGNENENENNSDFWKDLSESKQDEKVTEPIISEPEVKIDFALENETSKIFFDIKPGKKIKRNRKSLK